MVCRGRLHFNISDLHLNHVVSNNKLTENSPIHLFRDLNSSLSIEEMRDRTPGQIRVSHDGKDVGELFLGGGSGIVPKFFAEFLAVFHRGCEEIVSFHHGHLGRQLLGRVHVHVTGGRRWRWGHGFQSSGSFAVELVV